MANVQGQATHKKRAGMLQITEDSVPAMLVWKCADVNAPTNSVELSLDTISSLKATPETSDKMMLKIGMENSKEIMFGFNSRDVMNNVKVSIQQLIARKKTSINLNKEKEASAADEQSNSLSTNNGNDNTSINASSISNNLSLLNDSINSSKNGSNMMIDSSVKNDQFLADLLDEKKLIKNLALQQRLLRDNIKLMRTFTEAVIKEGMEAEEFWKSRVHLLRSFAIQNNQKRGPYNVLSTIKPVASSDNEVNVNVTRDKIKEIFKQYPVVRKAYEDNVPRMSEGEFWSRFFSSKLFRKLRGEKVNLYDRGDATLDKYLYFDPDYDGEEEVDIGEIDEKLVNEASNSTVNSNSMKSGINDNTSNSNINNNNSNNVNNVPNNSTNNVINSNSNNNSININLDTDKKKRKQAGENMVKRKKVKLFGEGDNQVSKCIDLNGNKEDDSQLRGNRPDITMKDDQDPELVGILRTMNRLSRRLMADIQTDNTQKNENNLDLEFEKELDLNDLDELDEVVYNELKYTQTSNVSSNIIPNEMIEKILKQSNLNPESCEYDDIIKRFKNEFQNEFDLTDVYKIMKKEGKKQNDAYKDINNIIKQNAKQSQQSWNLNLKELLGLPVSANTKNSGSVGGSSSKRDTSDFNIGIKINLTPNKIESVKLTHATSIEFLRQFWTQFNITAASSPTSDVNFKSDLIKLRKYYFSVKKCLGRVEAQLSACKSQKERDTEKRLLDPLVQALNAALKKYEDAMVKSK